MNALTRTTLLALLLALAFDPGAAWAAQPAAAQPAARPVAAPPLKGVVLETIDAKPYTYLRLKTSAGETWAAVPQAPLKNGASVTIENPLVMTDFQSKALGRTFDKIVFGTLAGAAPSAGTVTPAQMTPGAAAPAATAAGGKPAAGATMPPHSGATSAANAPVEKVAEATGPDARTVAEVYAQKAQLKGKTVVVRGKVAKFLPSIMGKNWVHLRDGTGTAAAGDNDLVVTTKLVVKTGDIVVAKGVVRTDVDVGMGSTFKVLVEDATFLK